PIYTRISDRISFMTSNHLHFMRWLRPNFTRRLGSDDGVAIALVSLPPANLQPVLIDPVEGRFQLSLPVGLDQNSVQQWALASGLILISYDAGTGIAIAHPRSCAPPAQPIKLRASAHSTLPTATSPR